MSDASSAVPRPVTEQYDDVLAETVTVTAPDGYAGPALLYRPANAGPHPGVAIGMEATGINHFIRDVAATLAHLGFVTIVPDYYRGTGPADTENYDDIDAIMRRPPPPSISGTLGTALRTIATVSASRAIRTPADAYSRPATS